MDERGQYSDTYNTTKGQYRYNYSTGKLERMSRKINVVTIKNRLTPIVEISTTDEIKLKPERFRTCPEYWVELYESVLERTVTR